MKFFHRQKRLMESAISIKCNGKPDSITGEDNALPDAEAFYEDGLFL